MNDLELIGKNKEGFTWYKNKSLTDCYTIIQN